APAQPRFQPPVREAYRDKIGHDERYTWITGQLFRLQANRDTLWVVCYATPEVQDAHGGSVLLSPTVDMLNFRDGDLVNVQGQILYGGRPSEQIALPVYRASDVNLIERGD